MKSQIISVIIAVPAPRVYEFAANPAHLPRWSPLRRQLEATMVTLRSALRRQERAVRTTIDKRLGRD